MKEIMIKAFAIAVSVVTITGTSVSASTLVDTTVYNGHTYQLWDSFGIRWAAASAEASAQGGYLATFTDAAETSTVYGEFINEGFFTANAGQQFQAWLGATPVGGSGSTTDPWNWAWVTGESWTAFDAGNFAGGEPNGDSEGLSINRYGNWQWNDEGGYVGGYILEKNSVPDAGSSLVLLSGALAMMGAVGRKFRS